MKLVKEFNLGKLDKNWWKTKTYEELEELRLEAINANLNIPRAKHIAKMMFKKAYKENNKEKLVEVYNKYFLMYTPKGLGINEEKTRN